MQRSDRGSQSDVTVPVPCDPQAAYRAAAERNALARMRAANRRDAARLQALCETAPEDSRPTLVPPGWTVDAAAWPFLKAV